MTQQEISKADLEAQVQDQKVLITQLHDQIDILVSLNEDLKEQNRSLKQDGSLIVQEYDAYEDRIEYLEKHNAQLQHDICELIMDVSVKKQQLEALTQTQVTPSDDNIQDVINDRDILRNKVSMLKAQVRNLEDKVETLISNNRLHTRRLQDEIKTIQEKAIKQQQLLEQQIQQLQNEVESKVNENNKLSSDYNNQKQLFEVQIQQLKDDVDQNGNIKKRLLDALKQRKPLLKRRRAFIQKQLLEELNKQEKLLEQAKEQNIVAVDEQKLDVSKQQQQLFESPVKQLSGEVIQKESVATGIH